MLDSVNLLAHLFFLLLLLVAYVCKVRGLLPKFNPWDFLLSLSRFQNHCNSSKDVEEDWEGLGINRYKSIHKLLQSGCEEEAIECSVCLCKIEDGDEIRELKCEHIFHRVCLDRWVGYQRDTCPLCRGSLAPHRRRSELGDDVELLFFKFCSVGSRHRRSWWLR